MVIDIEHASKIISIKFETNAHYINMLLHAMWIYNKTLSTSFIKESSHLNGEEGMFHYDHSLKGEMYDTSVCMVLFFSPTHSCMHKKNIL